MSIIKLHKVNKKVNKIKTGRKGGGGDKNKQINTKKETEHKIFKN